MIDTHLKIEADIRIQVVDEPIAVPNGVVYPVPEDVKARFGSDRFIVEVDGQPSPVLKTTNNNPVSPLTLEHMQVANHMTPFAMSGPVQITVRTGDGSPITSLDIRPKKLGIVPTIAFDTVTFTLEKPMPVSVEINETFEKTGTYQGIGPITKKIVKHPLFLLPRPQGDTPLPDKPGLVYFGPGIHEIGLRTPLASGTEVYIDGGAVVLGSFIAAQPDPRDILIHGHGYLSAQGYTDDLPDKWANQALDITTNTTEAVGNRGQNIVVRGITIMDPVRSCLVSYNETQLEHVAFFSWQHRQDGMTVGEASSSRGWLFLKTQDDLAKFYFSNQVHEHLIIWQQTSGSPCKLAWDLNRPVSGCRIRTMTVIHSDVFSDYSKSETDHPEWHSTSAIVSCMGVKSKGQAGGLYIDELVIEEENLLRLLGCRLQSNHDGKAWGEPKVGADALYNVQVGSLELAASPYLQSFLYPNRGANINKIWIRNLRIAGQPVIGMENLPCRLGEPGLIIGDDGLGGVAKNISIDAQFPQKEIA